MASKSSLKSIPSVKQSNPKSSSSSITQNLKPCNLSHSLSSPNLKISHQRFSTRAPSYRLITKAFIFDWFKPKPDPTKVQELSFGEMNEGDRDSTAYLPLGQKAVNSLGDLVPFTNKLYTGTIKSLSFVLLIIISLSYPFLISAAFGRNRASVVSLGWWRPIVNVTVPEVIETAQFALAEHNKQKGSMLKFARVVAGQYQVVAGLNYRLIIAAKNGAVDGKYEAVVYVGPWEHYKSLNSFGEV